MLMGFSLLTLCYLFEAPPSSARCNNLFHILPKISVGFKMNHWERCNEGKKCLVSAHRCCACSRGEGRVSPSPGASLALWEAGIGCSMEAGKHGGGSYLEWKRGPGQTGVSMARGSRAFLPPCSEGPLLPSHLHQKPRASLFIYFLITVHIFLAQLSQLDPTENWSKTSHPHQHPEQPVQHASAVTTRPLWILGVKPVVSDVTKSHALFLNIHFMLGFKPRYLRVLSPVLQS